MHILVIIFIIKACNNVIIIESASPISIEEINVRTNLNEIDKIYSMKRGWNDDKEVK